jgi:hypothetical protein
MPDLSLNGIVRQYLGRTKPYSVRDVLVQRNLRSILESIATRERSFDYRENCGGGVTFGGTAAYQQVWTTVIVRINLIFDPSIPAITRNNLMTTWRDAIQSNWSFKWGCSSSGESTCRLIFEVQWTANNPHHTVQVVVGPSRSNMGKWDTMDSGAVASHEFGHMLGLLDEYSAPTECAMRNPINTGTIMDNNSSCFPSRLTTQFASNLGSQVVGIAEYSHNPSLCT